MNTNAVKGSEFAQPVPVTAAPPNSVYIAYVVGDVITVPYALHCPEPRVFITTTAVATALLETTIGPPVTVLKTTPVV